MRRILNLFLLFCLPLMAMGEEISQQQAREKACAFMQQLQGRRAQALGSVNQNVQPVEMGLQSLYAFNCEGGGYVIVSGDDATTPILGYSPDGVLNVDEMPANLRTWLEGYADQIRRLQRGEAKAAARRVPVQRENINPLIESLWNQRAPFNWECPKDMEAGGVLSASGCVATAMSQVMFFHKWPQGATTPYTTIGKKDVPSTTFDWDNMLPVYEEGKYTEAQGNAVAHLMRWAGWSVDMQYAAAMSGAVSGRVEKALRLCFGYDKNTHCVNYNNYSLDEWEELIYNELANRRPVFYSGYNSNLEGHCFVCDGYKDGKFHFNWGWGGKADGFFEIRVLNPSFSGVGGSTVNLSWSDLNDATIGIQKPTDDAAIDYPPSTETNEGFYVFGPTELTRNSTKEAFPRIWTHFYVCSATNAYINQWAYRYALLKGNRIHCMLWGGRNKIDLNSYDLISIANFSVVLPDTLSDGEYRMVPMHETGKEPTIKDVVAGSQYNYIGVKIEGTKLTLKSHPEAHLEVSNPRKTFHEDDGSVRTVTFTVKNTGQEEYRGYINLYIPESQILWSYERIRLYPGETRDFTVTSKGKTSKLYTTLLPNADFSVYADRSFANWLYGKKVNLQQYAFGNLTITSPYIDHEKKIIKGNQLEASVSVTNQSAADYNKFCEFLILNADSLYDEMMLLSNTPEIGAGKTYAGEGKKTLSSNWKKVVFSFRYRTGGNFMGEIYSDVYTVQPVIYSFTKDGKEQRHEDCEVFETPENVTLVMLQNTNVKQVKPNQNPNTIYFTSKPLPEGLDNSLVVDGEGRSSKTLIFNTAFDALFTTDVIPRMTADAGLQHTFTAEETNCWLSMALPYDNLIGDDIKDVATGENVASKIKFYKASGELSDYGWSQGQIQVKADDGHQGFCLLRVDPSLAGKTVQFTEGTINSGLAQGVFTPNIGLFNNYCRQTKENVYVVEGNRLVLKQSCELKPFTQYLQLAEGVENPPAYLTITDVSNPSGIDEVRSLKPNGHEIYYDLQGRRIDSNSVRKGVYIVGKKKVVIK